MSESDVKKLNLLMVNAITGIKIVRNKIIIEFVLKIKDLSEVFLIKLQKIAIKGPEIEINT